jgi:hypothetical protein
MTTTSSTCWTASSVSVELLAADAAGILLADAHGQLHLAAASNEDTELMELMQLFVGQPNTDKGPVRHPMLSGAAAAMAARAIAARLSRSIDQTRRGHP